MIGPKPKNLIAALTEGVLSYLIYQSRCGMQSAYSEHLIYEPIVRIATYKNWKITNQFKLPKTENAKFPNKIDFVFESNDTQIAVEVKYLKNKRNNINVQKDIDKLTQFMSLDNDNNKIALLMITGRYTDELGNYIKSISEKGNYKAELNYQEIFHSQSSNTYWVSFIQIKNQIF